jgi:hypothetical protein
MIFPQSRRGAEEDKKTKTFDAGKLRLQNHRFLKMAGKEKNREKFNSGTGMKLLFCIS